MLIFSCHFSDAEAGVADAGADADFLCHFADAEAADADVADADDDGSLCGNKPWIQI